MHENTIDCTCSACYMEELGTLAEQYHKQWGDMFIEGCPCCFIEDDE